MPDAGRVGAAPGHLDRLAASRARLARASSARFRGSTRRSSRVLAGARAGRDPLPRRGACMRDARAALGCARRAPPIAFTSTRCRPIASGSATRRRPASSTTHGQRRAGELGVQRLGEVRQLAAGRAGRTAIARLTGLRREEPRRPDTGERLVLEGGGIEVNGNGLLLVTEEWLLSDVQVRNPGLHAARTTSASSGVARHPARRSGWAKDASATTRTATSTTWRASSARIRWCWPSKRIRPTRTTRARSTTCGGSRPQPARRHRAAAHRDAAVPAAGHHERRAAAGQLREFLHRATASCSCRPSTIRTTASR